PWRASVSSPNIRSAMGATEPLAIVQLNASDASSSLLLSTEAHWNQSEADWRFFLEKGIVFGVRDRGGRLVATAALLPYATTDAWISMVLVAASWRRRGLATRLVDRCLATAAKLKLTTWLDATPAGAAVYGPLGFSPTLNLLRLQLQPTAAREAAEPLASCGLAEFIRRDRAAIGFDRSDLLKDLSSRAGSKLVSSGGAVALLRDGRAARHIGPLFAAIDDRALALVHRIVGHEAGSLLIDAVAPTDEFLKGLIDRGWTIERPFQRMRLGSISSRPQELPFAVAGPEYG